MKHEAKLCEVGCRNCSVRESVLFAGLDEPVLAEIEDSIVDVTLEPGASLYQMGEPSSAAYTLREGLVKLVQYLPDGDYRIVRLAHSCDVLGLEALLRQPYQHEAIVVQRARLCRLPTDLLGKLDRQAPALHQELLRRWQRALTEADAWLTELSTGSARRRVVRLLLRLTDAKGNGLCRLFSRKDMGAMLGVTTESASRVVAELKRAGLLHESREGFRCDVVALRQLAASD